MLKIVMKVALKMFNETIFSRLWRESEAIVHLPGHFFSCMTHVLGASRSYEKQGDLCIVPVYVCVYACICAQSRRDLHRMGPSLTICHNRSAELTSHVVA